MASAEVITASLSSLSVDFDISEKLADSPFTVAWLLEALSENDEKFQKFALHSKVAKVTAVDISQGKGFISKVYKVKIAFDGMAEPYEVILKVPGLESLLEAAASFTDDEDVIKLEDIAMVHNRECDFYTDFASHIDIPLVRVFKAVKWVVGKHPGALLMESMVDSSASCPLWTGGNLQQMFAVAKHLATLMKHFLCLPQEDWAERYRCSLFDSLGRKNWFPEFLEKLKEMKPGMFDQGIEALNKYINSEKFITYTLFGQFEDLGIPPVLSHGDLWANNILWKRNADGSVANEIAAIIDWQIIHKGSITNDLTRFMTLCVDGELRREHEYTVLRYYYDTIVELMEADGRSVDFSYDQIKQLYHGNFVHQSMQLLIMGPFMFGSCEETPIKRAQVEKVYLRASIALEDALERLKELPEDKIL